MNSNFRKNTIICVNESANETNIPTIFFFVCVCVCVMSKPKPRSGEFKKGLDPSGAQDRTRTPPLSAPSLPSTV